MSNSTAIPAPALEAPEAFGMLGISDWAGYKAIREGRFPVPVVRIGRVIRVPRAPLEHLLGLDRVEA